VGVSIGSLDQYFPSNEALVAANHLGQRVRRPASRATVAAKGRQIETAPVRYVAEDGSDLRGTHPALAFLHQTRAVTSRAYRQLNVIVF
jgi:hypothetical protein